MEPGTHITGHEEITEHLRKLINERVRGDLKIFDDGDIIKVIFTGQDGIGKDSHLLLERLIIIGRHNRLDKDKDVTVEYVDEGVAFSFKSSTADAEEVDKSIRLRFPGRIVKNQKRRFYRINPSLLLPAFDVFINAEKISERCPVKDISASGLAFVTHLGREWLRPGMEISLVFTLPDKYVIKTKGMIRSHIALKKDFICGVEFIDMPENVQDRIVRFVFNLQKEEIKRRK